MYIILVLLKIADGFNHQLSYGIMISVMMTVFDWNISNFKIIICHHMLYTVLQFRDVAEDLKVGGANYRFVHDFAKSGAHAPLIS
jgi:hypothetical protein